MSDLYKKTFRGYLIDHHSPDLPVVTLENLDIDEYERFFKEANINHLMLYCKDHWGNSYYDTKIGKMHGGLREDWIAKVVPVLRKNNIEFNAYYCFEYDTYAPKAHPEWSVRKKDGTPLKCGENSYASIAKWGIPCYETGYREYIMEQLKEIITNYKPDSLFIDIFGKTLCYCDTCKKKFKELYGYDLPESDETLKEKNKDIIKFVDDSANEMYEEVKNTLKAIDPELAITINFASHYPKEIRDKLDYIFTEPWAGNWLSGAYARDTSAGKYPQLGPGDVSQVYNYQPDSVYNLAAAEIAAQNCRVFMYSEPMHYDGTLDFEEARKIGKAYKEVEKFEHFLFNREVVADVGIIQSDTADTLCVKEPVIANAIGRAKVGGLHRDALLGAMKLCDYSKLTWKVIPEKEIDFKNIFNFKMIILPNIFYVNEDLKELLEQFVKMGGIIISSGETGLYDSRGELLNDFLLNNIYGCSFKGKEEKYKKNVWSRYIKQTEDKVWVNCSKTTPPIFECNLDTVNNGAKVLGYFINPATELTQDKWVNWGYPLPGMETDIPAIYENSYGNGRVIYTAFDFFAMENKNFKWLKDFFSGVIDKYLTPSIFLETAFKEIIGYTAYERCESNEIIVHEISHMAKLAAGDTPFIDGGKLKINKGYKNITKAETVYPECKDLGIKESDNYYEIDLNPVDIHQIVRLKYKA